LTTPSADNFNCCASLLISRRCLCMVFIGDLPIHQHKRLVGASDKKAMLPIMAGDVILRIEFTHLYPNRCLNTHTTKALRKENLTVVNARPAIHLPLNGKPHEYAANWPLA